MAQDPLFMTPSPSSTTQTDTALAEARALLDAQVRRNDELERALAHAQPFESLGLLVGRIAHDFNNVLATVSGALHLLKRSALDDRSQDLVQRGQRGIERATPLVRELMGFAQLQTWRDEDMPIGPTLTHCMATLEASSGPKVRLIMDDATHAGTVKCDAAQLQRALSNLVRNACDAMPAGGDIHITAREGAPTSTDQGALGSMVSIEIRDGGTGMTADVLAQACQPFYTTKSRGPATGLGLAMASAFAQRSGGRLLLQSEPGRGTVVTLVLPRGVAAPSPAHAHAHGALE